MSSLPAVWHDKKIIKKEIWALTIGIWLCILALTASQLAWSRHQVFLSQASQAEDLARSLAQNADNIVRAADIVLQDVAERVRIDGTSPAALARVDKIMAQHVADDSRLYSFTVIGSDGELLASSRSKQGRNQYNVFDRPYFALTRDATEANSPTISDPVLSRADNHWVLIISRAIHLSDGSFGGLVNCSVSVELLQKLYDSINVGQYGAVQLNNVDSILMVRHPFGEASINGNNFATQIFESSQGPEIENKIDFVAKIGHSHQLGTAIKIPRYHLQVAVSFDQAEMLAGWWHQFEFELALLTIMLICALVGFNVFIKQAKLREASEMQYRLLADHSSDVIVVADLEGKREYVSPSFYTLTGWSPELLEGKSPETYTFSEDIPAMYAALQAHKRGENPGPTKFRYVLPDGQFIWMEMVARLTPGSSTVARKFICSHRDVSMRIKAEEALATANAELSELLLVDPLTGIANRRGFDQGIEAEWHRAMRNQTSTAMMMIDVDRFKAYNDYYGHVEGDHCLRAVAQVLKSTVRWPGDVVARYGGEEFAIIMPDTTATEAADVAERLQNAIVDIAIPHAMSEFQYVTISIGLAVLVPKREDDFTLMIQMADQAVYDAKKSGRNQITIAKSRASNPQNLEN